MANVRKYSNWLDLTPEIVTSLYKYGTETPPPDLGQRLWPEARSRQPPDERLQPPAVYLDAADFMVSGPGRYAKAAKAEFVRKLFNGEFDDRVADLNGKTLAELRRDGIIVKNQTEIAVRQKNWDLRSGDYAQRTFIYNSGLFRIDEEAATVVHENGRYKIKNLRIVPISGAKDGFENFDFISSDPIAATGNKLLQKDIDPHRLGKRVLIQFDHHDRLAAVPTYDATSYSRDQAFRSAHHLEDSKNLEFSAGLKLAPIVSRLEKAGVIPMPLKEPRPLDDPHVSPSSPLRDPGAPAGPNERRDPIRFDVPAAGRGQSNGGLRRSESLGIRSGERLATAAPRVIEERFQINKGSRGEHVAEIQRFLNERGYTDHAGRPVEVDGEFGPRTKSALTSYQKDRGLLADGVVARRTMAAMVRDVWNAATA